MFYLSEQLPEPVGYVTKSYSHHWEPWLAATLPGELDGEVRHRLISNLKHIIVGLEMKAALVEPHHLREHGRPLLFEPYAQILHFEFCTGVFSVCEGFGSSWYLVDHGLDGALGDQVSFNMWKPVLVGRLAGNNQEVFEDLLETVKRTRDRLHQDRLGARENIDWHAFDYEVSFQPALQALHFLFRQNENQLPERTNLRP